jgi:hypothetical protein
VDCWFYKLSLQNLMFPFKWQIVYGKQKNNKSLIQMWLSAQVVCQRTVIKIASMMGIPTVIKNRIPILGLRINY